MPVSSKEERDRRSKTKEKADPKQRKRMVIEEVESDEDSQGNSDILFYTRQIVLKKKLRLYHMFTKQLIKCIKYHIFPKYLYTVSFSVNIILFKSLYIKNTQ